MIVRRPSGFIAPCQQSKVARPPSGPFWVHEIKHDGYRLMARRDGSRIRCFTRNGYEWAHRFSAIVAAALRLKTQSFLIDGEAVIARPDRTPDFHALRSRRRGHDAVLCAFDLIEHDGDDLPRIDRKRRLAGLIGRAKRRAIRFNEHLTGDGPSVFEHVCRMGAERHRVEANGCALSQRAVEDLGQVEEPREEGRAALLSRRWDDLRERRRLYQRKPPDGRR